MKNRKIYYSFNDVPFSESDKYNTGFQSSGIKFSKQEITHILIAMTVLTIAFSFVFVSYPPLSHIDEFISFLPLSFLAIATAFFCHEIAHKYAGQKFGYWSEFRMYPQGLMFALFLGIFFGVVFAAPGAVQIFGRPNKDEMGKIAVAGPIVNIILGLIFISLWYISDGIIANVAFLISYINVFFALFNLLPFGPLDGLKIFKWKVEIWGFLIGIDIILFIYIFIR